MNFLIKVQQESIYLNTVKLSLKPHGFAIRSCWTDAQCWSFCHGKKSREDEGRGAVVCPAHTRGLWTHTSCYSHKYCSFSHRFYRAEAQTQGAVRFFHGRSAKITELKKTSRQKPIPHCLQVSTKMKSKTVSQHKQGWQEPSCIYNNCLFVAYWGSQAMHKEIRVKKKQPEQKANCFPLVEMLLEIRAVDAAYLRSS